ncbi:metal-dependent transcriptional regulator [Thiomicrospira sp. S5]|jgi:DtxR family Mn-dependent transcriptional regulator|uniref:metal-dependent transcriptional regulator n=1 Tax=Thiomicrospira sp. S5 TaxID=1803865 RepID=UPI0004A6DDB3|nr:metal-dependent transcriptional regulator [Thiomicrospira sp. S5]AZR82373.1 DNA-binding protein [Thiomicrospira sp. S5]
MASKALEDYLKIIYKLEEANETDKGVSTSAIAERLAISQASVSNMLKKLADKALIRYEPYYGVALSDAGRKVALGMIRKHRILELFLVERLGYQWDEVDEEAEVLEHAISDKLTNRMWEELGRPTEDPHGSPIPDESGEMIEQAAIGLSQADLETTLEVIRIQNRSPEELRYLFSIGLVKGAKVRVLQKAPFDGPISIEIAGTQHPLDFRLAESIFVA